MHTVIILNKHTSELLKDFKFLFKPFVSDGSISFCDWNESGTDIQSSVPDLYKKIKGKKEWRAVVVTTESMNESSDVPVADMKNPFDFVKEDSVKQIPKESEIPLVRLTHMLCGYPTTTVKNFERGFEYTDEHTGKICRVRVSEMTEEEIYQLSADHGDQLKSIYMEEKTSEEHEKAQKELIERYAFSDVRPREMILIATRKHFTDEDHIYASWKNQLEMESSDFCSRNKYPSICRFLCYSITNAENSMYMKELIEFWISVLTLSVNRIQASSLQAYKLYRMNVTVSIEEMEKLLNDHLNKMSAAYQFVEQRLKVRPVYSFEGEEELVEKQSIPVIFEGEAKDNMYVDAGKIGLSRDCPKDEMSFWNFEVREKLRNIEKYMKAPRRAIDKASQHLKDRTESFYGDEYELDKFQLSDLKEEIERLEMEILASNTRSIIDEARVREEINKTDKRVKQDISVRMRKSTVLKVGALVLAVYLLGFVPYLINSYKIGTEEFFASIGLSLGALALAGLGGLIALFILRKRIVRSMEGFNDVIKGMVKDVNASADKFEDYFSLVCTYMKAQSIYRGTKLKGDTLSSAKMNLRAHKQALRACIERDEELAVSYGVKRNMEVVRNVTSFFDENKLPKDNSLYYFESAKSKIEIPLNSTGDLIKAPYSFVAALKIEREDIFDDMKGEY